MRRPPDRRAPRALVIAALALTVVAVASACLPINGNVNGTAVVPLEARAVDTSNPTRVVGTGTPGSCTSNAVVNAVALGGIITFSCGPDPVTITLTQTAKVVNTSPDVVIDGGGLVTLSGGGTRRILYMNTCDQAQIWTTNHCQDQDTPRLVVRTCSSSTATRPVSSKKGAVGAPSSCGAGGSRW